MDKEELMKMAEKYAIGTSDQHKEFLHEGLFLMIDEVLERAALELDKKALDISFLMPGSVECAKIVRALKPSNVA